MVEPRFNYTLPVNYELGFPQTVFTTINNKFFAFTYRFNSYDDSLILKWVTASGRIVFIGKLVEGYEQEIRDPDTGISVFLLLPVDVEKKNIDIWLYAPWLI